MSIDLGHDHTLRFFSWAPDRELNPQFADLPDIERAGAIIGHRRPDGTPHSGAVTFDGPMRAVLARGSHSERESALWTVESFEPLTISPSVLCSCGDHGFIRNGRWEPA